MRSRGLVRDGATALITVGQWSRSRDAKLQLQLQTPMGHVRRARGAIRTSSAI